MQTSLFEDEPQFAQPEPATTAKTKGKGTGDEVYTRSPEAEAAYQASQAAKLAEIEVAKEAIEEQRSSIVYTGVNMRYYQKEAIKQTLWQFHHKNPDRADSTLIVMPTGSGKSVVVGGLAAKLRDFNKEYGLIVMAHRKELLTQMIKHLGKFGIPANLEKANDRAYLEFGSTYWATVASVQTLSRPDRLEKWDPELVRMIITDEAHHATSDSYKRITDYFYRAHHVGVTATPDRADGNNLGQVFQTLAYEYKLRQAIADGYLMNIKVVRVETDIDLKGLRLTADKDFNPEDLEALIEANIEPLANLTKKEIGTMKTIIFTPETTSAHHMALALQDLGISARHITYKFPPEQRERTIREYEQGKFQVLVNATLLTEGFDCPGIECVVIARPTRSRGLYSQMVGRGTRPDPNNPLKTECIVVDFGYNCDRLKLVSPVDLFDNSEIRDDVIEKAREIMENTKDAKDIEEAIEEAQREVNIEIAKRAKVQARKQVRHGRMVLDPLGVIDLLGIPKRREAPWMANKPASVAQLETLEKFGVKIDWNDPMSSGQASNMIGDLVSRANDGKARVKQVRALVSLGVPQNEAREFTFQQATDYISKHKTW